MQVAAGCNQKKTSFGCSINAKIEKIILEKLQLKKETIFSFIKPNVEQLTIYQLKIVNYLTLFF